MLRSLTPAAIVTVAANALALAAAFGFGLSEPERVAVLAFVGSITSLVFTVLAAVHVRHVSAAVKLASGSGAGPATPAPSSGSGA